MTTQHTINASDFQDRTIVFPAVFAKAVNRFKQININQDSIDLVNTAISKKIEPSLKNADEKIWAQWKSLIINSHTGGQ
jgi:hypothetical protein